MTVYKVGNVYYNEQSIQQYIDENHSFADFVDVSLKDSSGNLRGLLNTMFTVWNSEDKNDIVNYLSVLNYMYVSYVNNVLSKIPKFTVLEGDNQNSSSTEISDEQSKTENNE